MSRHQPPPAHIPTAAIHSPRPNMTETQRYPHLPPATFHHHGPYRPSLPPLSALDTSGPPPPRRPDQPIYSPQATLLPAIQPQRLQTRSHPPPLPPPSSSTRNYSAPSYSGSVVPGEKPVEHVSYGSRPEHTFSPQHYGPTASPRTGYDPRIPPRTTWDSRYRHEESRPHPTETRFVSPIERSQKPPNVPPQLPSPAYSSNHPSSNPTVRSSFSSHASSTGVVARRESIPPASRQPPQVSEFVTMVQPTMLENSPFEYKLIVRQQPVAARACGFGERDRRVIDPPPIIQLQVTDKSTGLPVQDELRYGSHVVHCALWDAEGAQDQTSLHQDQKRTTRRLMGQLVASPSVAKDEHDIEGCFFCFPDLSCRTHGQYTLKFILMRINTSSGPGDFFPILTEVQSRAFTVYTAKDFPGMRPSSSLTRALKLQGCNIQVKKGKEKAFSRKRVTGPSSDDDDDGEDTKRRRKE